MLCTVCHYSDSGITGLSRAGPHTTDHVTELSLNHNELYTLDGISAYTNLLKVNSRLQSPTPEYIPLSSYRLSTIT